jgi:hypothetical protein
MGKTRVETLATAQEAAGTGSFIVMNTWRPPLRLGAVVVWLAKFLAHCVFDQDRDQVPDCCPMEAVVGSGRPAVSLTRAYREYLAEPADHCSEGIAVLGPLFRSHRALSKEDMVISAPAGVAIARGDDPVAGRGDATVSTGPGWWVGR